MEAYIQGNLVVKASVDLKVSDGPKITMFLTPPQQTKIDHIFGSYALGIVISYKSNYFGSQGTGNESIFEKIKVYIIRR